MICSAEDHCLVFSVNISCSEAYNTYHTFENQQAEQKAFTSPIPWIGFYVALASLLCTLAMAADVLRGLKNKKHWFPCNYFTLNAASLTFLAIAVKLPVDLASPLPTYIDQLAKLSGSVFVCTVMGNVMPSLGSMKEKDILMNVVALDILVITLVVDLCIQVNTGVIAPFFGKIHILVMCLMVIILVVFNFSALVVPTSRNYLQRKYHEIDRLITTNEDVEESNGNFTAAKLARIVEKYWMISETGSPQYVMARSKTCCATGAICFALMVVIVVVELVPFVPPYIYPYFPGTSVSEYYSGGRSDYKCSTFWILATQTIGILVGTIGPALRWFTAYTGGINFADVMNVENYWIQMLVEWKERPITLQIRSFKWKRLMEGMKNLILDSCIAIQKIIVIGSKITCHASILLLWPIWFCSCCCKSISLTNHEVASSKSDSELDLRDYMFLLEGEEGLPKADIRNISDSLRELSTEAKRKQPKRLLQLLGKSTGFKGVSQFDSDQVQDTSPKNVSSCWTLPVVTLTSIAIALPNISSQNVDRLLVSVTEGLKYINLIDKCLNNAGDLVERIDAVWLGVGVHRKWLRTDLQKLAREGKTSTENLQQLAHIAGNEVTEWKNKINGGVEDSLNWPINVLVADSMYRISSTTLANFQHDNGQTDEELFEKLSIMVADIIRACLTNLPRVITIKCCSTAIAKREYSVQQAARLVGETEEILRVLHQHQLPNLNTDQLASIDHWRALHIS